jgi:hypothetical protein
VYLEHLPLRCTLSLPPCLCVCVCVCVCVLEFVRAYLQAQNRIKIYEIIRTLCA